MISLNTVFYTFDKNGVYWVVDEIVSDCGYIVSMVDGSNVHIEYRFYTFNDTMKYISDSVGCEKGDLINWYIVHCHMNGVNFIERVSAY